VHATNLTRIDAVERSRLIAVDAYDVDLDLTTGPDTFAARVLVRFSCREPGASTFIDLVADSIASATLNGAPLDVAELHDVAHNRLQLPNLAADNELVIEAAHRYSRTGEGLHRFVDPVDDEVYMYTQFESSDAQRMFACFDQPDLKATYAFTVTAPEHWEVISNEPHAAPEPVRDGVTRRRFGRTPRMSTYITALVAGPYHHVHDVHQGAGGEIPLGIYCRRSLSQYLDPDEIFEITHQGFGFFERQFGRPYPFTKYDQLFVPEFNAGAMENAGCVTFLEDYVFRSKVTDASRDARANTILHEMAHMWFGDLVTMRWWDDLWLNESFAEFMAYDAASSATRFTDAWTGFATGRKAWGLRQDQLPSTHPISADAPDIETVKANFDGITYAKGASTLRQLVAWVGHDEFMEGVRAYFARHAWGNTELSDFLVELERTSGRDLTAWSKEWLETAGCNTLRPSFTLDDGRGAQAAYSSFSVVQEAPADHPTLRSHRIAIGVYDKVDDRLVRRQRLEIDVTGPETEVPELVGVRQPDLLLLNDDDLTFAKVRLDDRSLQTLTHSISSIADSLPRALCWASAWDMTRDGEMRARDFVDLVAAGIGIESDMVTIGTVVRQVRLVLDQFADPDYRPIGVARLASAMRALTTAAAPGSDHQLAFLRTFINVASTGDELDYLAGLLDGTTILDGLAVDPDVRWALLLRLVLTGRRGDDAIAAELERDNTANGRQQAATVKAARPSAEAKAEAWAAVVESDELPNALQHATIAGFHHADQRDLLRPYRDRYFASIDQVWDDRTNEIASSIVQGLFPMLLVEQETLDAADAYLTDTSRPAALRRLVLEGRDGVARAMRAQACDRS
jgi:aminopeptidase N